MNSGASLQRLERCLSERLEIARSQLDERNDEGLLNSLPGGPVPYMIICAAWSIILLVLLGFAGVWATEVYGSAGLAAVLCLLGVWMLTCWQLCCRGPSSPPKTRLVDSCDATSDTEDRVALKPYMDAA